MHKETEEVESLYAMAHEDGDANAVVGLGVDYKTLFLGACTGIVLLSGAAFRIWDNNNHQNGEAVTKRIEKLEERLTEMEARQIEHRFRIEHLEKLLERR